MVEMLMRKINDQIRIRRCLLTDLSIPVILDRKKSRLCGILLSGDSQALYNESSLGMD